VMIPQLDDLVREKKITKRKATSIQKKS
jgi:hypothetical protein